MSIHRNPMYRRVNDAERKEIGLPNAFYKRIATGQYYTQNFYPIMHPVNSPSQEIAMPITTEERREA